MKYRGREVWEDFKIITAVCPKDTELALAGSVFVAGAWFLIQFVNSCLLRTVAKFGQEKGHAAVLLLFLFGLYVAARVPTVLGYRLSGLCAERIVGTANRNLLRTWLYRSREGRLLVSSGKVLSLLLNDSGSVMSDFLFMGFTINFVEPLLLGILSMAVFLMWKPVVLVPFFLLGIPSVMLNRFFQQRVKVYSEQERESFDDLTKFFQYLNEQLVCIRESGIYELLFKKSGSVGKHAVGAEKKKENTIRRAQFVSDLLEDISLVSCVFVCVFLAARQQIEMADLAFVFAFAPFIFRFFNHRRVQFPDACIVTNLP
jgi:ABC-type multidrug transport system fused ATPase/permease subunit